jgi:hypothetical protein
MNIIREFKNAMASLSTKCDPSYPVNAMFVKLEIIHSVVFYQHGNVRSLNFGQFDVSHIQ